MIPPHLVPDKNPVTSEVLQHFTGKWSEFGICQQMLLFNRQSLQHSVELKKHPALLGQSLGSSFQSQLPVPESMTESERHMVVKFGQ